MIIKPRMPRVITRSRQIGRLGMRSLQRSMIHVRRMLISRLPEDLTGDLQEGFQQPLGWDELPAPQESGPILDAPRWSRSQPRQRAAERPVQRSEDSGNRMPRDLQAVFDMHKRMGRVQTNPVVKRQATTYNKSGGVVLPDADETSEPVQRTPEKPNLSPDTPARPAPKRRQVRSRVEYVNRPDPDMVRRTREALDIQQPVEEIPVESLDEEYDFVNTFPPDDFADEISETTDFTPDMQQVIQRDIDDPASTQQSSQREPDDPATTQDSFQRDVDDTPESPDPVQRTVEQAEASPQSDTEQSVQRGVEDSPLPEDSIQRAVEQAEASPQSDTEQSVQRGVEDSPLPEDSIQRAAETVEAPPPRSDLVDTERHVDVDDTLAAELDVQQNLEATPPHEVNTEQDEPTALQRAIEAAEAPPDVDPVESYDAFPTVVDYQSDTQPTSTHDTVPTTPIQRDIEDAGYEPAYADDDASMQTFVEPTRRRMTMSDPQAPTQIQRTTLPDDLALEDEVPGIEEHYDDLPAAADDFVYDDAGYEASVQPVRDDVQRLPEQDIDLGEALFGDEVTRQRSVPEHDGPTPTLMPPIGKLRHTRPVSEKSMPKQVARRTDRDQEVSPQDLMRMASASVEVEQAREEAISKAERPPQVQMSRDEELSTPDDDEAQLLTLLDLPPDTPIQRTGTPMPTPSESTIQRDAEDNETSEAPPETPPSEGDAGPDLDETARQVLDVLKRKHFRIDKERYKGKK